MLRVVSACRIAEEFRPRPGQGCVKTEFHYNASGEAPS